MDIQEQDFARSEEVLTRLVKQYPRVPEFDQSLGSVYYMEAQLDKAQSEYGSQLAIEPHNPQALSMVGVILLDRGDAPVRHTLSAARTRGQSAYSVSSAKARPGPFRHETS